MNRSTVTPRIAFWLLVAFLATLACNDHGLVPLDKAIEVEIHDATTQTETNKIDILWVIDNSNSMCEEQDALTANFQTFINGLADINADFRLAVITTDMSSSPGVFRDRPGPIGPDCSDTAEPLTCGDVTGPVLSSTSYQLDANNPNAGLDIESLQSDFRCIATVGTVSGEAGFERGLDTMRQALSVSSLDTINSGFRRDDAWLAIIFVTDENDCSHGGALELIQNAECEWLRDDLVPVSTFVDFVKTVQGTADGDRLLVAGIIGPDNGVRPERPDEPQPSCSNSERGTAFSGYRYADFINSFGDRGIGADICHDSFQVALDQITRVIRANLATKCLRRRPPTCEIDLDCSTGETCEDRGEPGVGIRVCSDFDLAVETYDDDSGQWEELAGPETGDTAAYLVNYEAASCANNIGIEFTTGHEPRPGDQFRVRYTIAIGADDEAAAAE